MSALPKPSEEMLRQAWRATDEFRKRVPMLRSIARALTGNPSIGIELTEAGAGFTDGKNIYLCPPISMGILHRHTRHLCGVRDGDQLMVCEACRVLDELTATLVHEMAHIIFDSTHGVTQSSIDSTISIITGRRVRKGLSTSKVADRVAQALSHDDSYLVVAELINPYLPSLINGLEDARINASMFKARPGTKVMLEADTNKTIRNGVEHSGGVFVRWTDYPENAQVMVGCYLMASGYDYRGCFDDEIMEVLEDDSLRRICNDAATQAQSVTDVFELSLEALDRLNELGYLCVEDDESDDEDQDDESDGDGDEEADESSDAGSDEQGGESGDGDDAQSDGQSDNEEKSDEDSDDGSGDSGKQDQGDEDKEANGESGREPSDNQGDQDSDDRDPQEGDGKGDDSDSDNDHQGNSGFSGPDAGSPQEVEAAMQAISGHGEGGPGNMANHTDGDLDAIQLAVTQQQFFDDYSAEMVGVMTVPQHGHISHNVHGEYPGRKVEDANLYIPAPSTVNASLQKMRVVFAENKKSKQRKNLRSGRINSNRLSSVMAGNDKVFSRTQNPGKRDYFVCVTLDMSGSTNRALQSSRRTHRIQAIKHIGMTLGEMLSRVGVDFAVYGHEAYWRVPERYNNPPRDMQLIMHELKTDRQPWDDKARQAVANIGAAGFNMDGHTMEFCRKRMDESSATDKLMLYVTDGQMPFKNAHDELPVLKRELKTCKDRGYTVLGCGVETDSPKRHGLETVQINNMATDMPKLINMMAQHLGVN